MQLNIDGGPMEQQLVFRINDTGVGPELLEQVFLERGWIEYDEEIHGVDGWNIWWRTTRFRTGEYTSLLPWQWINHFPNCTLITKKDALCRNIRKMRVAHGFHVYNFCPQAFNLPNDYTKFVSEYANTRQQKKESPATWICKPAESSRGRGIFVFKELSDLQYDCNAVVQQYITDPLLIGGYKFDIRIYVAIPSFHPLQIYIHEEGLVRFSTEKYDLARLDNVFSHLTNTSINKHSPGYTADKDQVGHGCKWTISHLRRYFLQNNINDAQIWRQITNIIILTILIQAPSAPKIDNCFELYGFDILIDQSLKAWLLEVNFSPSLSYDCQVDVLAKKTMLHDMMALIDFSDASLELTPTAQSPQCGRDVITARTVTSSMSYSSHPPSSSVHGSGRLVRNPRPRISERRNNAKQNSGLNFSTSFGSRLSLDSCEQDCSIQTSRTDPCPVSSMKPRGMNIPATSITLSSPKMSELNSGNVTESNNNESKCNSVVHTSDSVIKKDDHIISSHFKEKEQVPLVNSDLKKTASCGDIPPSDNSDSGLSSLSSSSDNQGNDNNNGILQSQSNINIIKGRNTPLSLSTSHDTLTTALGPAIIDKLQDTPRRVSSFALAQVDTREGVDALDTDGEEGSHQGGINFEMKLVKGNMKGQGVKQIMSPIPPSNVRRDKQSKSVPLSKRTKDKNDSRAKDRWSNLKTQGTSPIFNATNAYRDKYSVPRNLSVLEASRFQHQFYNGRVANHSPGKNGRTPLAKIPKKRVGRFYLVFPFNEATQKLSSGKLDPRLIIKEMLKKGARKKKQESCSVDSEDTENSIWAPVKSAD